MISIRSFIMTRRVSTLAFIVCLASWLASAVGQTNSTQCSNDVQTTPTQSVVHQEADHSAASASDKKKGKKKAKHNAKPAPSKQEQEFEKVLQGIFG